MLGRVLKKSGKVLRWVLKKVGKIRVGLNKIGLKFSRGKILVTCEKLSHFSPTFFPRYVIRKFRDCIRCYSDKRNVENKQKFADISR